MLVEDEKRYEPNGCLSGTGGTTTPGLLSWMTEKSQRNSEKRRRTETSFRENVEEVV